MPIEHHRATYTNVFNQCIAKANYLWQRSRSDRGQISIHNIEFRAVRCRSPIAKRRQGHNGARNFFGQPHIILIAKCNVLRPRVHRLQQPKKTGCRTEVFVVG